MRMRIFTSLSSLTLIIGGAASGHVGDAEVPAATQAEQIPPLAFKERKLANGLIVYTSFDPHTPRVSVQVWYKVGAAHDPDGRSGFAHLFEHLMFKGSLNIAVDGVQQITRDVGGSSNAATELDATYYYNDFPASYLEAVLFAEADRMRSLALTPHEFETEREVVISELKQRLDYDPYARFDIALKPFHLFAGSQYGRPAGGAIAELQMATFEEVERFHYNFYNPNNAFLIVSGNFRQEDLDKWIDKHFASIPNTLPAPPRYDVHESLSTARHTTFYGPHVPAPLVSIVWPAVSFNHPDRAALSVLSAILSTGRSSRLYRALALSGLAATVNSSLTTEAKFGTFEVSAILTTAADPSNVQAAIRSEIASIQENSVSASELLEAKAELLNAALLQRETPGSRAWLMGLALIRSGGDPDAADRVERDVQNVTIADVRRVARTYLSANNEIAMIYRSADDTHPVTPMPTVPASPIHMSDLPAPPKRKAATAAPPVSRSVPSSGAARTVAVPQVVEGHLANGLRVISLPIPGGSLVSARLVLRSGSRDEGPGQTGLANLTAQALQLGTAGLDEAQVTSRLERLGARLSVVTSADTTTIATITAKSGIADAMQLIAGLAASPTIPSDKLEQLSSAIREQQQIRMSNQMTTAIAAAQRLLYETGPYGSPTAGIFGSPLQYKRADVIDWHRKHFRPESAALILTGDITAEEAMRIAATSFGDWHGEGEGVVRSASPAGPLQAPQVVLIDRQGAPQAAVVVAARGPSAGSADFSAREIGNAILGSGWLSRLNQEIRVKRGLSYGAWSQFVDRQDGSMFLVGTETRSDAAAEVVDLIRSAILDMNSNEVSSAELSTGKAVILQQRETPFETADGAAQLIEDWMVYGLPLQNISQASAEINRVSTSDVKAAMARHAPASALTVVVVGDGDKILEPLQKAFGKVRIERQWP